jgi:hypothetical protein
MNFGKQAFLKTLLIAQLSLLTTFAFAETEQQELLRLKREARISELEAKQVNSFKDEAPAKQFDAKTEVSNTPTTASEAVKVDSQENLKNNPIIINITHSPLNTSTNNNSPVNTNSVNAGLSSSVVQSVQKILN